MDWFDSNGRDFPWREGGRSPYEILVAEILLQKTRANRVEEIYLDFLERLPSIKSINSSSRRKIKKILSPLGLQERRSRLLKRISRKIIAKYDGKIPSDKKKLEELPGVGPYISKATLCFAFGKKVPVLDANVARILGRCFSLDYKGDLRRKEKLKRLSRTLLSDENPQDYNYALLDLGALVCTSGNMKCGECPLANHCDKKESTKDH